MTSADFKRIQETEGGGGKSTDGYSVVVTEVTLYDGRKVEAMVLQGTGRSWEPDRFLLPSKRSVSN
jgi:hypothetical protein